MGSQEQQGAGRSPRVDAAAGQARIRVLYFADLRERRGKGEETISTEARNPAALYSELALRHGFPQRAETLAVAVNDEIAGWDTRLRDGDTVVFLTPFGGG